MDIGKKSVQLHKKFHGKIEIASKVPLRGKADLAISYTPGVALPCQEIHKNVNKSFDLTWRGNTIAIVTDGSAVLGLGNIGAEAALPVMEGKAMIFKKFANINAVPICLRTQDPQEICHIVQNLEANFAGINLEDICAPKCFQIEKKLSKNLQIPIFHDDQHGTAIATLAALKNALKVVNKKIEKVKIVFSGAGAAGIATAKLLHFAGAKHIILCDSQGTIYKNRKDLNSEKKALATLNLNQEKGSLQKVLQNADVFIGLSKGNILKSSDIKIMSKKAIVFAMANPIPEILPLKARQGGAFITATGRSDFPNQINNALVFPGIFKGALQKKLKKLTQKEFYKASCALAQCVKKPTKNKIIPSIFEKNLAFKIANSI